ncbi:hypothetical protein [Aneurinibacillus migulanus]|uniref:hypothetical protein n=1 Tax=Aneurinibacillus migulanus TaxID=47500 RepID=UPI00209FB83A|nr:hypothetical protein [Aneurinibacillus migulanus]MCP1354676.1 hypothetical protein [Aneurinibacillus migulanus]
MAAPWEVVWQYVSRDNFGDSYPNYIRVRFYKETGQNILVYALYASDSDSRYTTNSQLWVNGYDFVNYRYAFYIVEREAQTKRILEAMPTKDGDFLYTTLTPPIPTEPGATIVVARQLKNQNPTIILSTQDNITLTDGSVLSITGSASDADSGDVLTVKYKIDNGTVRNIASGVASGTPLSFAKNLTFSNKRLRDGATEVTGDLAENVDHILTVWAEDDKGGKSTEVTRKFRVIHNRPPVISGTNEDLGTIQAPPSKTYTVSDAENDTFTVTEKIDGKVIRSFAGVAGQENTITIPHDFWIRLQPGVQHTLAIEATDSKGMTAVRTYAFVRQETKLEFKLKNPFVTDIAAKRILVTLDAVVPNGAIMKVEACNNAFDASPTWEDVTNHVRFNRGFLFTNTEKTAAQWGVDIRFVFEKGTATSQVIVNGFGGAFD